MKTTRLFSLCILFGLSAALLLSACSALPGQATPTPEPVVVDEGPPYVNATGKVVPAQWARLSLQTQGVVEEVLVKEGETVKAGAPLLRLNGTEDLQAAISAAQTELTAAEKALDDLNDVDQARTAALDAISAATKQVRDAQYQLDNFTMPQTLAGLSVTEALSVTQKHLDEERARFEPYKYYPSGDRTRKDRKEDLDDAQADYNSAVKQLQYITELQVAQDRLSQAQEDYETWKDGPDPKDVKVAQARVDNARVALAAAQARLDDLELRAPFDGTVSEVNVKIGEWANPGQPVLVLADLEHLQVETTDLNEIDAARVAVGSPVLVTFDALPGVQVDGVVFSIAPKASEGSGVNYKVIVRLDEIPAALRWGMTAFTDIEVANP